MIVPDSSHGTNPASAAMAGFKVVVVPSNSEGMVDLDQLRKLASPHTAGLMITNPNTLGIFEKNILEIAKIVHQAGGLLYYDGANFHPLLGKVRPGDMGFDIVHLNLHKTFATPHGGGGPGCGPVGVTKWVAEDLPVPVVSKGKSGYYLDYDLKQTVGRLKGFVGNSAVLLRAYAYIRLLGADGLANVSSLAVLAANYLWRLLDSEAYPVTHGRGLRRKHETVVSVRSGLPGGAMQTAKALLDYGMHAPTVYFPLIVSEALMVEPTESEPVALLDQYDSALNRSSRELKDGRLGNMPRNTSVGRVDEVKPSHPTTLKVRW